MQVLWVKLGGNSNAIIANGALSPVQVGVVYLAKVGSGFGDLVWQYSVAKATNGVNLVNDGQGGRFSQYDYSSQIISESICGLMKPHEGAKESSLFGLFSPDFAYTFVITTVVPAANVNPYADPYSTYTTETKKYYALNNRNADVDGMPNMPAGSTVYDNAQLALAAIRNNGEQFWIKDVEFGVSATSDSCGSINNLIDTYVSFNDFKNNSSSAKQIDLASKHTMSSLLFDLLDNMYSTKNTVTSNGFIDFELPFAEVIGSTADKGGLQSPEDLKKVLDKTAGAESVDNYQSIIENFFKIVDAYIYYSDEFNLKSKLCLQGIINSDSSVLAACPSNSWIDLVKQDTFSDKYREALMTGGWAQAGLWYFEISRIQNVSRSVYSGFTNKITRSEINKDLATTEAQCIKQGQLERWSQEEIAACTVDTQYSDYYLYLNMVEDSASRIKASGAKVSTNIAARNLLRSLQSTDTATANEEEEQTGLTYDVASFLINYGMGGGFFNVGQNNQAYGGAGNNGTYDGTLGGASSGTVNPFFVITNIGHAINEATIGVVLFTGALSIFSYNFGIGSMLFDKDFGGVQMGKIGAFISAAVLALLLGSGYTLAYVIPFTPALVWILVVVGWLTMLVEAIIAAPLAVVMMVTPEGEGVAGRKMERAINFVTVILMKPFLSIMGLIASTTIAYVAFGLFNQIFWDLVAINTTIGIFELLAVLLIYTSTAMLVTRTCFNLIHLLPNNILEWMNTSGGRTFGENEAAGQLQESSHKSGSKVEGAIEKGKNSVYRGRVTDKDGGSDPMAATNSKLDELIKQGSGSTSSRMFPKRK